ncbi:molybdopterin biosynthesis protein MoeB [Macrococcoides goetzii]|uniref:Molybdopterin biosynthesis protein MoeB n=1 Tax=Macrococcoides goetzii TaxID=1891097 RepID=A0A395GBA9_9STAP|nr:ThiF family adenylyltransferase [Macrococcus goetzii]RAI81232.1 molybdopterin biosynthesis protein MoeB [Macrococcus goetzii]
MTRYDRQIKFYGIGDSGHHLIEDATVGIIGCGALGTHLAESIARSGVKKIVIVDRDYVEVSNLQRQSLFKESDAKLSTPKVVACERELKAIRSDLELETYIAHCDTSLLEAAFLQCDCLLDATDNFETRQVINDFSYKYNIPWIYGACVESTYVACPFIPGVTPCFNCVMGILPVMNRTCDTVGIIEPAVSLATSYQMMYCLKILSKTPFDAKLVFGDVWQMDHTALKFSRMFDESCATCGRQPTYPYLQFKQTETMLCGRDTVQFTTLKFNEEELKQHLENNKIQYAVSPYFIRFKFEGHPMIWFKGGRLLIHEVKTVNEAKKIYHQLFG